MKDNRRLFAVVLSVLALGGSAACGGPGGGGPAVVARDSAGVRVVTSVRPAWEEGRGWAVNAEPDVAVGMVDGPAAYQFSRVRGAVRLSTGTLVVADGDARELRYFDAEGRHLRTVGRGGGGPGEFQSLEGLAPYRGDSVVAWDATLRRLSVFGPDGVLGRAAAVHDPGGVTAMLRGVLNDGSVVLEPTETLAEFARARSGERRDSVAYVRFTAGGERARVLARRADREQVTRREGARISRRPVLFGRDSYAAAGGGRVYVGENDAFRVDVLDAEGRMVASVRRAAALAPVDGQALARARAAEAESRGATRGRLAAAGIPNPGLAEGELPVRETVPAYDRLLVDADGALWVRDFLAAPDDPQRWSVFSPDGAWLGTVDTPAGLEILQVGATWVLGRGRDELDVESVRLHRLQRSPAGGG